jgi:hypothetical protein
MVGCEDTGGDVEYQKGDRDEAELKIWRGTLQPHFGSQTSFEFSIFYFLFLILD